MKKFLILLMILVGIGCSTNKQSSTNFDLTWTPQPLELKTRPFPSSIGGQPANTVEEKLTELITGNPQEKLTLWQRQAKSIFGSIVVTEPDPTERLLQRWRGPKGKNKLNIK
jgi:hypothetical protein